MRTPVSRHGDIRRSVIESHFLSRDGAARLWLRRRRDLPRGCSSCALRLWSLRAVGLTQFTLSDVHRVARHQDRRPENSRRTSTAAYLCSIPPPPCPPWKRHTTMTMNVPTPPPTIPACQATSQQSIRSASRSLHRSEWR